MGRPPLLRLNPSPPAVGCLPVGEGRGHIPYSHPHSHPMRMAGSIAPGLQWGPLPPSDLRRLRLPSIGPERLVELVGTLGWFALLPFPVQTPCWGQEPGRAAFPKDCQVFAATSLILVWTQTKTETTVWVAWTRRWTWRYILPFQKWEWFYVFRRWRPKWIFGKVLLRFWKSHLNKHSNI